MSDDGGTAYRAAGQGQGGGLGLVRHLIRVLPALPATATRLTVRVDRFVDPFPRGRESEGPWTFEVPLEPSGAQGEP